AAQRAFRGHAPSRFTVLLGAVAILTAVAGVHVAAGAQTPLRVVQLAASIVALFAVALLLGIAPSPTVPGAHPDASAGPRAVRPAGAEALAGAPPRHLDVELVLAGAGEGPALGMRAEVRRLRRRVDREDAVVLELRPCGRGRPRYWTRDGLGLPLRLHPRLV